MSGAFQFEEQTDGADSANYFGGFDGGVPQADASQPAKNGHVPSGDGDAFGGFGSAQAASSDFGATAEPALDFGSFDTAGTQQPQQAPKAADVKDMEKDVDPNDTGSFDQMNLISLIARRPK